PGDLGDTCGPTRQQVGGGRARPHGPRVRLRGVTLRRSTYEPFEQRQAVVGGEWGGKAAAQGERAFHLTRTRHRAGLRVSPRCVSVRTSFTIGRHLSERRTGCANERSSGSVRGVSREWYPYRDPTTSGMGVLSVNACLRQLSTASLEIDAMYLI